MSSLYSLHWIGQHRGMDDAVTFKAWNPPFAKIISVDERPPYTEDLPAGCKIIVRNHPLSEMYGSRGFGGRDPAQIGREHATACGRMADYLTKEKGVNRDRLLFEGINEPMLWSDEPPAQTATYYAWFLTALHGLGLHGVCGNFGVGWPNNTGPDTPVNWAPFEPMRAAMTVGDYLGLHEYWSFAGPAQNWRWWGGRFLQCPWSVNILITECGIDAGVEGKPKQGWLDLPGNSDDSKAITYVAQLADYEARCRKDSRVKGLCIFTYDYGSNDWERMSIRNSAFMQEFLPYVQAQKEIVVIPVVPLVVPPTDRLVALLKTAFGAAFVDLRASLPRNTSVPWFGKRDLAAVTEIVVHHTAGSGALSWATVAQYEMNAHPTWPGIAYSIGISPAGTVSLLADIDEKRGATGNSLVNATAFQVCCGGNFENDIVTPQMLAAVNKLVTTLSTFAGKALKVIGHRDVPGDQTACPGAHLYAALFAPVAPPTGGPSATELLAAGDKYQVLRLNPAAALQQRIYRDGFSITSNEFPLLLGGVSYVCQRAEELHSGTVRVYFATVGDWSNVKFVER
jgi:N-acetylmuramoyl-L-alanine amidase